jgi:hypothetical protein
MVNDGKNYEPIDVTPVENNEEGKAQAKKLLKRQKPSR